MNSQQECAKGFCYSTERSNYVDIYLDNGRHLVVELYPKAAPLTVDNFQELVNEGFYDGLIFHRIIEDFMVQGGDPSGTGMGGSDRHIKGEFSANGVENPLKHERGVISMARSMSPDSASSQFFIVHKDAPHLDGQYAAFGRLIFGLDALDDLATCETDASDRPLEEKRMARVFFVQPA